MMASNADRATTEDTQRAGSTEEKEKEDFPEEVTFALSRVGHPLSRKVEALWGHGTVRIGRLLVPFPVPRPAPLKSAADTRAAPNVPTHAPPRPVFVLPGLGGETSRLCRPHPRASSLRLGKELLSPHRPLAKGLPGGQRGFLGLGRGYKSIRRAQAEIERRLPQTGYIIFKRQLSNRKSIYLL